MGERSRSSHPCRGARYLFEMLLVSVIPLGGLHRIATGSCSNAGQDAASPETVVRHVQAADGKPLWRCEFHLYRIGQLNQHIPPILSPDYSRVAFPVFDRKSGTTVRMDLDGREGQTYDEVPEFIFSPNSKRNLYHALEGEEHLLVVDGREQRFRRELGSFLFSPDSKRLAYQIGYGETLVLDGEEIYSGGMVDAMSPVFSPDSKHFAFCATTDHDYAIYVDQKPIDRCDELLISSLQFSPDSSVVSYAYRKGTEWFLALGAEKHGPFSEIAVCPLISQDSRRIAFGARSEDGWYLLFGGQRFGPYDFQPDYQLSPNSKHLLHTGTVARETTVYLDGKPLGAFERAHSLGFSADGQYHAWIGQEQKVDGLFVDGRLLERQVTDYLFSPDGQRLAFARGSAGGACVVEAGWSHTLYERVNGLQFSPDSKHLTYWAQKGEEGVLDVDGNEVVRFHGGGADDRVYFTEDGRIRGAGLHRLVTAGEPGPYDEAWFAEMRFVLFELTPVEARPELSSQEITTGPATLPVRVAAKGQTREPALYPAFHPKWPSTPIVMDLPPSMEHAPELEFSADGTLLAARTWQAGDAGESPLGTLVFNDHGVLVPGAVDDEGQFTSDYELIFPFLRPSDSGPGLLWYHTNRLRKFAPHRELFSEAAAWAFSAAFDLVVRVANPRNDEGKPEDPYDSSASLWTVELWELDPEPAKVWGVDLQGMSQTLDEAAFFEHEGRKLLFLGLIGQHGFLLNLTDGSLVDKVSYGTTHAKAVEEWMKRAKAGEKVGKLEDLPSFFATSLSCDSERRWFACGDFESRRVRIVSLDPPYETVHEWNTGDDAHQPPGGGWRVERVRFAGQGRYLIVEYHFGGGGTSLSMRPTDIFETTSWSRVWHENTAEIDSVCLSQDGRRLAFVRNQTVEMGPFKPNVP
ncbi:MAG: hypothetical protein AB1486_05200 [Planctomycetota bacterium]